MICELDHQLERFQSVYGPVRSWRYGSSLGIDPIGERSACSFNCVYCQLGDIQQPTCQRQVFVATEQIAQDLVAFAPWGVDVVTLSGSGEPTLALNLGEILSLVCQLTGRPSLVLTNSSLLGDPAVRSALALADRVAVKLDAITPEQFRRVNRPMTGLTLDQVLDSILQFRQCYGGQLAVQTMMLTEWSEAERDCYRDLMQQIQPDEIHLNTPTRPRPLQRQIDSRGNDPASNSSDSNRWLKPVAVSVLAEFAARLQQQLAVSVRYPDFEPRV